LGRPTFAPASLFTAAILMTLANPNILWDVGFQLSFAATLGLMIYVDPWKQWVDTGAKRIVSPALVKRFVRYFGDIFIATLAAMLLSMPLIIYHFQQLSIVSPLANFFVLPAQPGVMSFGIIAMVTGMVFPVMGRIQACAAWPFLTYTI
jgi:competence protein ComEC